MSIPTPFDPSKLRLGVADQLSATHVAPVAARRRGTVDPGCGGKASGSRWKRMALRYAATASEKRCMRK